MTDSTHELTEKEREDLKIMRDAANHMSREELLELLNESHKQLIIKTKVLNQFMRKNIQLC